MFYIMRDLELLCVVYYVPFYVHYASNMIKSVLFALIALNMLNVHECNNYVLSLLLRGNVHK